MQAINEYKDGSGYWYVYKACDKYLKGFDWLGRAIWTDHGHEARVYKDDFCGHFSEDGPLRAKMLRLNPCVKAVRFKAFAQ